MRKKVIISALTALLCLAAMGNCMTDQQQPGGAPAATHRGESSRILSAERCTLNADIQQPEQAKQTAQQELIKRFIYAICFVAVLAIVAWYSRKIMPKLTVNRGKDIHIVETIRLGGRKSLHVVAIGADKKILIGCGGDSVNLLAEMGRTRPSAVEVQNK